MADDLLISTDVDALIRVIRNRGTVELRQLAREAKMPESVVEKWVHILEEQELIKIDYRLTSIYVNWLASGGIGEVTVAAKPLRQIERIEEEKPAEPKHVEAKPIISIKKFVVEPVAPVIVRPIPAPVVTIKPKVPAIVAKPEAKKEEKKGGFFSGISLPKFMSARKTEVQAQAPAPAYAVAPKRIEPPQIPKHIGLRAEASKPIIADVKRRPEGKPQPLRLKSAVKEAKRDIEDIRRSLVEEMKKREEEKQPRTTFGISLSKPAKIASEERLPVAVDIDVQGPLSTPLEGAKQRAVSKIIARESTRRRADTGISGYVQTLHSKIEEINAVSQQIAQLKQDKEKLVQHIYRPLEKKFESELEVISDRLIEKEKTILDLQQRAIALPAVVSEIEGQFEKLQDLEHEARTTFDGANVHIDELVGELRELREDAIVKVDEARRKMSDELVKVESMRTTLDQLSSLESEVRAKIEEAKVRVSEQNERIDSMAGSLAELAAAEEAINEKIADAKDNIGKQSSYLKDVERELTKIAQVDKWVEAHKSDYGLKIDEFARFVDQSEQDYAGLRDAVEANFAKRYLSELRQLTKEHEYELGEAAHREQSIDEQIASAKEKLSALLAESRELTEVFEQGVSKAPGAEKGDVTEIIGRKEAMYQTMRSKASERESIAGAISSVSDRVARLPELSARRYEQKKLKAARKGAKKARGKPAQKKAKRKKAKKR